MPLPRVRLAKPPMCVLCVCGTFLLAPGCIQVRHQLAFNAFLAMTFAVSMRQNISVAMVAMVNSTVVVQGPRVNGSLEDVEICSGNVAIGNSTEKEHVSFDFDQKRKVNLL